MEDYTQRTENKGCRRTAGLLAAIGFATLTYAIAPKYSEQPLERPTQTPTTQPKRIPPERLPYR